LGDEVPRFPAELSQKDSSWATANKLRRQATTERAPVDVTSFGGRSYFMLSKCVAVQNATSAAAEVETVPHAKSITVKLVGQPRMVPKFVR
jgi:hypothetical protein